MKERPILMSAPMIKALLAGRKTQTRRVVRHQPVQSRTDPAIWGWYAEEDGSMIPTFDADGDEGPTCPYGKTGDGLWVRETGWQRPVRTLKMMREGADTWKPYYYDADELTEADHEQFKAWGFKRRPSIFMPRWASRIKLVITNVRVERLQEISDGDALAEGCLQNEINQKVRSSYHALWESLNSGRGFGWHSDPWVWVVSFVRVP